MAVLVKLDLQNHLNLFLKRTVNLFLAKFVQAMFQQTDLTSRKICPKIIDSIPPVLQRCMHVLCLCTLTLFSRVSAVTLFVFLFAQQLARALHVTRLEQNRQKIREKSQFWRKTSSLPSLSSSKLCKTTMDNGPELHCLGNQQIFRKNRHFQVECSVLCGGNQNKGH